MLVLSRKRGESLVLELGGVAVQVEILPRLTGDGRERVRVGVVAPRSVRVFRGEIWEGGDDANCDQVDGHVDANRRRAG